MYQTIVHLHSTLATLLLLFLIFRLFCKLIKPQLLHRKWVKIASHIFDGGVVAFGLVIWTFNHWIFYDWLILKFFAIIIYILSTFYALKKATGVMQIIVFGLLSIGSILLILGLAHSKSIFFL